jgi:histidinol-phosphate aminotransferase
VNDPSIVNVDEVRPLWVLPDAVGLILLGDDPGASDRRASASVVGELLNEDSPPTLVLLELDGLTATELTRLVRGTPPSAATRITRLHATLDPALACLAPSLARAQRLVEDENGPWRTSSVETSDLPGGVVECARVEAARLHPATFVPTSTVGYVTSSSRQSEAVPSDDELAEALTVLDVHSTKFRPVIVAAFVHDELGRLSALLQRSSDNDPRPPDSFACRVIIRALSPTAPPDVVESEVTPPRSMAPRAATPAARALEKVATVAGYRRGRAARGTGSSGKLSANESPFGPPPAVLAALSAAAEHLNRYPEEDPVLDQLAAHLGIDVERLVLTNGSDELCYLLARLLLDDTSDVAEARRQGFTVVGEPCYQIDATASTLAGAPIVRVPLIDGAHDLGAMAHAAGGGATLVWLPSPHNPTGVAVAPDDLAAFVDQVPSDCLVVLDEAYGGFTQRDNRDAALNLTESRPNLLIQRTFSKDWGLAGVRVGYAVGDATLIAAIRRARPPFSVNALALAAVSAVVNSEDWRATIVSRIVEERALLESTLEELGVAFFPSEANFVTCALPFPELRDALAAEGLSVRDGADLGLPDWTRITVGWAPQMAALRDVLRRHVEGITQDLR